MLANNNDVDGDYKLPACVLAASREVQIEFVAARKALLEESASHQVAANTLLTLSKTFAKWQHQLNAPNNRDAVGSNAQHKQRHLQVIIWWCLPEREDRRVFCRFAIVGNLSSSHCERAQCDYQEE